VGSFFSYIKKKPRKASRLDTTRLFLAGGGIERSVDDTTVSIKVSACRMRSPDGNQSLQSW